MPDLEWKKGQAHDEFISQLAETEQSSSSTLSVDLEFVNNFIKLSSTHIKELSDAMSTSRVSKIAIKNIPPMKRPHEARFQELCAVLGTMSGMDSVVIDARNDKIFSISYTKIIGSLQPVKMMRLMVRLTDKQAMQEFAASLANHQSLESLHLRIPGKFLYLILPAINKIRSLTEMQLDKPLKAGPVVVDPAAMARAMAGLFCAPTNPSLRVTLLFWDFSSLESHNILCEALGHATVCGVNLASCSFPSTSSLAEALTRSQLREVGFSSLKFAEGSVSDFLDHLTQGVSSMKQLEKLDVGSLDMHGDNAEIDEAVVRLTHAVALCRQLRPLSRTASNSSEAITHRATRCADSGDASISARAVFHPNSRSTLSMLDLCWKKDQAHGDFISQLAQTQQSLESVNMTIDSAFITNFLALWPAHAGELLDALKTAQVSVITLADIPSIHPNNESRFQKLCAVLGTMSGIKSVFVAERTDFFSSSYVKIIGSMRHAQSMAIWGRATDELAMEVLAARLANQGRLKVLKLFLPCTFYHLLLPAIYAMSSLTDLTLSRHVLSDSKVDPPVAMAMAEIFCVRNAGLRVTLRSWDFSILESNIFCAALSCTTILGVQLHNCSFDLSAPLAEALTQSKLREVGFSRLKFAGGSVAHCQFLNHLTHGMSNMVQLEKLECGSLGSGGDIDEFDKAMVQLTLAVAQCRRLRVLEVSFHKYSGNVDAALAECLVPVNSRLEEVRVWCDSLHSNTAPRVTRSPALLKALAANGTLRDISLLTLSLSGPSIDPWDPFLKKSIEMFPKRDRAGPSCTTRDAVDHGAGRRVLEAVNDNLDSRFDRLHQENPDGSTETGEALQARGRERTAPS